jgi:hypothetical protein
VSTTNAPVGEAHARRETSNVIWEAYWKQNNPNNDPIPPHVETPTTTGSGDYYPTEQAIAMLSAYVVTKDPKWKRWAVVQLDYAHSLETDSLLLVGNNASTATDTERTSRDFIHKDPQARQIYNFYLASQILKDDGGDKYYEWAVLMAAQTWRHLGAQNPDNDDDPHYIQGGPMVQLLFRNHVNVKVAGDIDRGTISNYWYDGNNCSQVGLAFALLAADPRPFPAVFPGSTQPIRLTKSRCTKIAMYETRASMAVQNSETGEVLQDYLVLLPDTMYGALTCFCWVWVTKLNIFGDGEFRDWKHLFEDRIQMASKWLGQVVPREQGDPSDFDRGGTMSYLFGRYTYKSGGGHQVAGCEHVYRLAVYWHCKTPGADTFIDDIFRYLSDKKPRPNVGNVDAWPVELNLDLVKRDSFLAGWAYYPAMGFDLARDLGIEVS